jgi:hypothetical protein
MRTLPKIITGLLTSVYTTFAVLMVYSYLQFPDEPWIPFDPIPFMIFGFFSFALLVFYCNHLAENESVSRFSRVLWFIRFFILGFIAFPLYWISFVMRSSPEENGEDENG